MKDLIISKNKINKQQDLWFAKHPYLFYISKDSYAIKKLSA